VRITKKRPAKSSEKKSIKSRAADSSHSAGARRKKASSAEIQSSLHDGNAASHREDLIRLNRIRGQIEGIERMITDGRYCLDIVNQIRSVMAAVKSVEGLVLERHLKHCVHDAIEAKDKAVVESKIGELLELFSRR
jgi:CsoR family transcriptional regulator, copper-sensing transcriptional repressor